MAGCAKNESESEAESTTATESPTQSSGSIQLKSYRFPEFLSELGGADMLSNVIYQSFNSADVMVEPEKQPFEGYKCTACFGDSYYVYKDGENYGLMNSDGIAVLEPYGIKSLTAVSATELKVKYDDGTTAYFQADGYSGEFIDTDEFDSSRISFARSSGDDENSDAYTLQLDGEDVYGEVWTSAEEINISELDTERSCEAVYKTTLGGDSYYIAFDRFYNFTVYEAPYAFICLKIGGEYGECYVADSSDYAELETLISSFGSENSASPPSKDENYDYIQITLGLQSDSQSVLTVSADGYCLTDNISSESGADNKFFTVMSTDTFADLISWVDSTLGKEYGE
jgi:hypothetical protein